MKSYFNIIIIFALFALASCKTEIDHNPPVVTEEAELALEISVDKLGNGEATVSFLPDNDSLTYYYSVITASEYRANDGDAYVVKRDMAIMKSIAESEMVSLSEYLKTVLKKGQSTYTFTNLKGNEDYYVCAYEMDLNGNAGLKVFKKTFRSAERFFESYKFDFEVLNLGKESFDMKVTPETEDYNYLYFFIDDMTFEQIGGENGYEQYMGEFLRFYSERYGVPVSEVVSMLAHQGEKVFAHTGLLPKTDYYSIVALMDEEGNVISNISAEKVTTQEVDYLDVTFTIDINEIGFDYAKIKVTPSEETSYLATVITAEDFEYFKSKDEKLMMAVIESYGMYLAWNILNEEYEFTIKELDPESTYYVLAFGADSKTGMYTTRLTSKEFTTIKEEIPTDVTFDITVSETSAFTTKIDYVPSNANVNYFFDAIEQSVYQDTYGGTPEGLVDYMNDVFEAIMSEYPEMTKEEMVEALQQRGNYTYQFNFLEPDKTYYAWAVVIDKQGNFVGSVSMKEFKSLPFEQSETSVEIVLDKYFDGSELAGLDPYQYGDLNGKCVAPVVYQPSEDAVHWYVRAYDGDLTGPDPADQDLIRDMVMNGTADAESLVFTLPWNANLTYCAVAVDADGKFGKVTRVLKKYDQDGASPADEFVAPSMVSRNSEFVMKPVFGRAMDFMASGMERNVKTSDADMARISVLEMEK